MASSASSKKQIIESIKDKKNILVTVSNNPSVDELSAALGLTIFLNKLDKYATAIASGTIPSALDFLDPEKTFEATADSLRDFIIALDKEKADHLRYKLDGDVVKIFITPYRTTITQKDLEFSQGDYNVELVLALNVGERNELDRALAAHGKILHDATVATISTGDTLSSLGTIEWHNDRVSGVSEMVAELIQELKTAKAEIDEQIATALLTGIVAATERFSNDLTSSKAMTISAELMASGANQQLIAAELQKEELRSVPVPAPEFGRELLSRKAKEVASAPEKDIKEVEESDPTRLTIDRSSSKKEKVRSKESDVSVDGASDTTEVSVGHRGRDGLDEVAERVRRKSQKEATQVAKVQLSQIVEGEPKLPVEVTTETLGGGALDMGTLPPVQPDIAQELEQATEQLVAMPIISKNTDPNLLDSPIVGGTLNATTVAAAEKEREDLLSDQNRTILTHSDSPLGVQPAFGPDVPLDEPSMADVLAVSAGPSVPSSALPTLPVDDQSMQLTAPPVFNDATAMGSIRSDSQSAMDAVVAALDEPVVIEPTAAMGLSTQPVVSGDVPVFAGAEAGSVGGLPPMPDFNSLPPLPAVPTGVDLNGLPPLPTAQPQAFNPAQFQIPPQE